MIIKMLNRIFTGFKFLRKTSQLNRIFRILRLKLQMNKLLFQKIKRNLILKNKEKFQINFKIKFIVKNNWML